MLQIGKAWNVDRGKAQILVYRQREKDTINQHKIEKDVLCKRKYDERLREKENGTTQGCFKQAQLYAICYAL